MNEQRLVVLRTNIRYILWLRKHVIIFGYDGSGFSRKFRISLGSSKSRKLPSAEKLPHIVHLVVNKWATFINQDITYVWLLRYYISHIFSLTAAKRDLVSRFYAWAIKAANLWTLIAEILLCYIDRFNFTEVRTATLLLSAIYPSLDHSNSFVGHIGLHMQMN